MNWNQSLQYAVTRNYILELSYQGSASVGLIETWPLNSFPLNLGAGDPALQSRIFQAPQNYRPFPNFGDVNLRSNFGHSTYHSGTIKLEKRYSHGLNFMTFYSFSKAIDSGPSVAPVQNRSLGKGRADFDRTHRFAAMAVYELREGEALDEWEPPDEPALWRLQNRLGTALGKRQSPHIFVRRQPV